MRDQIGFGIKTPWGEILHDTTASHTENSAWEYWSEKISILTGTGASIIYLKSQNYHCVSVRIEEVAG